MADADFIRKVYEDAKLALSGKPLDSSTLLSLSITIMEIVEKLPNLACSEKKRVVIEVIKLMVDDTELSPEDNAKVDVIIETVLPISIDLIVAASRGSFNLNGLKNKLKHIFSCCK